MKLFLSSLALLMLAMFLTLDVVAAPNYSRVVIFGDSLSDTGNLASVTASLPYPYYHNRISDGPIAVDYVTDSLGSSASASKHLTGTPAGYNYAVAGGNVIGTEPEDLPQQISAYLTRQIQQADPNALYLFIIGGNDLREIRSDQNALTAHISLQQTADTLISEVSKLVNAGAKHIMISNVPNIGRLPETIHREDIDPGVVARATSYSQFYNQDLSSKLNSLKQQVSLIEFDLYIAFENMINNAATLGFTHTTVGCFDIDNFSFHSGCHLGFSFNRFVFFDNLHPTGKSHQLLSVDMINAIESASKDNVLTLAPIYLLLLEN